MSSEVRALLGDLVVATTELVETHAPPDERWLWLVIASGLAVRARPDDAAPDLLAAFAPLVWSTPLGAALADLARRPLPWSLRCAHRSALELLRELFATRDIDTSALELAMIADGPRAFAAVAAPDGIPEHHWWWHRPAPPGELRMNHRMANLLALGATVVPLEFRRLVAEGFVTLHDCVFLRRLAPQKLHEPRDRTGIECDLNAQSVQDYLPRDDSRRPVDLASSALACARWLAAELRRLVAYRCRIIANVSQVARLTSTIRFHRLRPGESWIVDELEGYRDEGVLVLDSRD
jgi:hypothetical protein